MNNRNVTLLIKVAVCGLCLAFTFLIPIAQAGSTQDLISMQSHLESRITKLLSGYDANGFVVAHIKLKSAVETKLPSTPFVFQNTVIKQKSGQLELEEIRLTLYTSLKVLPQEAIEVINEIGSDYNITPILSYKTTPTDFRPIAQPIDASPDYLSKADETLGQFKVFAIGLLVAGIVFLLAYLVIGWMVLGNAKKRLTTMGSAAQKLASAIEENAGGGAVAALPAAEARNAQAGGQDSAYSDQNVFAELEDESLLAILTDCYWCKKDEYASFVWNKIPTTSKTRLMEKIPFLNDYVGYVATLAEQDLGYAKDPYYLTPSNLWEISNEVITEAVRGTPVAINMLSPLRIEGLDLSAIERIELAKIAEASEDKSDLSNMEKGELRVIRRKLKIRVKTDDEERELLQQTDLTLDQKENIVSIVWVKELNDKNLETLVKTFNARELASAWVGVEDVLDVIKTALPPKKLTLLENYLKREKPSRDAPAYLALHSNCVALLKLQASEPEQPIQEDISADESAA